MKTTVELPDGLLSEAKSYAAAHGLSLKQVLEAGLRQVLGARRKTKPFRLRKHPFRGSGLATDADWPTIREKIYKGRGG